MTVVMIEYVDMGAQGEYGFFGKRVAASEVRGMTEAEIAVEVAEMKAIVGDHVMVRVVEEIAAVA